MWLIWLLLKEIYHDYCYFNEILNEYISAILYRTITYSALRYLNLNQEQKSYPCVIMAVWLMNVAFFTFYTLWNMEKILLRFVLYKIKELKSNLTENHTTAVRNVEFSFHLVKGNSSPWPAPLPYWETRVNILIMPWDEKLNLAKNVQA